jgi:hypothetical protein
MSTWHDPVPAMANNTRELWCFAKDNAALFPVTPLGKASLHKLKHLIWAELSNAKDLVLWKVSSKGLADSLQLTSYP